MRKQRKVYAVLGLVLSLALAVSLMSCATTAQIKMLQQQVQQASQDAKDAKALAAKNCNCDQQMKNADAAAMRSEKAADAAEASAQKASDMANKAEMIFNKQMKK
jgi:hypothetical protein